MPVVPKKPLERIQFYEDHNTPWTTNATAIGTTAADVTALNTKTVAARAAYNAHTTAQQSAKAASQAYDNAVAAMSAAGAAIIKQIRSMGQSSADPNVYVLAEIPAPATPAPVGAPGTPSHFAVALGADGSLGLTWKCVNPAGCNGVVYQLWRRTGTTGPFSFIGGAGLREFTDSTIPAGTTQVVYQLQAVRSTGAGPWAQFIVNFGTGGAGLTVTAAQTPETIAA
jgi:hypothetical protein